MKKNQNDKSNLLQEPIAKEVDRYLDFTMSVTKIIIDKLRNEKITKREFARSLGKNESQISEWLSGRHNFTLRTLADISAKYELDFSEAFKLVIEDALSVNQFIETSPTKQKANSKSIKSVFRSKHENTNLRI